MAPADGHSRVTASFAPLAWRGPPVVTPSDSRPSKGTAPLDLPCCPARRRPSFLTTVTRNKTNQRQRRTYSTHREHPRQLRRTPETQGQSTFPCSRPRHSHQSACLIFQAPRRRLLFAITWYDPPCIPGQQRHAGLHGRAATMPRLTHRQHNAPKDSVGGPQANTSHSSSFHRPHRSRRPRSILTEHPWLTTNL